jgi:hypothetical protein
MFGEDAMSNVTDLDLNCADFLKDNRHLYAHKARRKKIALIRVDAANRGSSQVRIELGAATLVVEGRGHTVESPRVIIRKFSEFTWDFVAYSILDFHPVLVFIDAFFFLTGPLYNRRLKKQLRLLSDSDMVLAASDSREAILGFRGVQKGSAALQFSYRKDGGEPQQMRYDIPKSEW